MKQETRILTLRLPLDLADWIRDKAKAEGRKISDQIRWALRLYQAEEQKKDET